MSAHPPTRPRHRDASAAPRPARARRAVAPAAVRPSGPIAAAAGDPVAEALAGAYDPGVDPQSGTADEPIAALFARQLEVLQAASARLSRAEGTEAVGRAVVEETGRIIDYHNARVYVLEPSGDLVPIAFEGRVGEYDKVDFALLRTRLGVGFTGWVGLHGEPLLVRDANDDPRGASIPGTDDVDESMLVVPMRYDDAVVGVITLSKLGLDQFDGHDLRLLSILADQAATALESARNLARSDALAGELRLLLDVSSAARRQPRFAPGREHPRPPPCDRHGRRGVRDLVLGPRQRPRHEPRLLPADPGRRAEAVLRHRRVPARPGASSRTRRPSWSTSTDPAADPAEVAASRRRRQARPGHAAARRVGRVDRPRRAASRPVRSSSTRIA